MAQAGTTVAMDDIQAIVDQIVAGFHPLKVILFGSRAWGEPGPDSDVDLLVVMEVEGNPLRMAARIAGAIPHTFPIDVLVMRPGDLRDSFQRRGNFATEIVTKGVVLYEAGNSRVDREGGG